jgi:hypothetical protein
MSQENVQYMEEAFQAFTSGDVTRVAELLDDGVQWQA